MSTKEASCTSIFGIPIGTASKPAGFGVGGTLACWVPAGGERITPGLRGTNALLGLVFDCAEVLAASLVGRRVLRVGEVVDAAVVWTAGVVDGPASAGGGAS